MLHEQRADGSAINKVRKNEVLKERRARWS